MSDHHCHALGCKRDCPPRWLMCASHWRRVPAAMQAEVYRTVKLRGAYVDASWAPWWRAQAQAIAHVAFLEVPSEVSRDVYLAREMATADRLEAVPLKGHAAPDPVWEAFLNAAPRTEPMSDDLRKRRDKALRSLKKK